MTTREMIEEEMDAQKPLHVCQGCFEQMLPPEHGICLDCMATLRRERYVTPGSDLWTWLGMAMGFGCAAVCVYWSEIYELLRRAL